MSQLLSSSSPPPLIIITTTTNLLSRLSPFHDRKSRRAITCLRKSVRCMGPLVHYYFACLPVSHRDVSAAPG